MPPVEVEETHLGPLMDQTVADLRRRQRPTGSDRDYDLVREHFDHVNWALQAIAQNELPQGDPIATYLANGPRAVNSPDVNFSMKAYLERHPERRDGPSPYVAWLREGRAAGEVADPAPALDELAALTGRSVTEIADELAAARTDLQQRLLHGRLGEVIAEAAEIEPMIGAVWPEVSRPKLFPVPAELPVKQAAALHAAQAQAGHRRAWLVMVINRPRWGGGRRIEGHLAHALSAHLDPAEIVVVHTDESGQTPVGRYPDGVREIDLAGLRAGLGEAAAERVLVDLLRSLRAEAIININSRLLYRTLRDHGPALAESERLYLCLFCNEMDLTGAWHGWPMTAFYRYADLATGIITDSDYLADWLGETYAVPEEERDRIEVFRAPVDPGQQPVAAPAVTPGRRSQVFWSGRWDLQKRIDLVLEIARRMPDVDFRMWGEPVLQGRGTQGIGAVPDNVRLQPKYDRFDQIALEEADAWLYTSGWDGVPSLLLEVAMTGIPLVGTVVGGTGEVLGEDDAWPVPETAGPEAYVRAIRDVLDDPGAARRKGEALRERMLRERSTDGFRRQAFGLLPSLAREVS